MEVDDSLVFQAGSTTEDGVKAAAQMMNESTKATAVQAATDLVAIGFADTILGQGVKIPQEMSVVGFGNTITSEYFRVPLTTVRQPKFRLGLAAVEMMLQLLRGQRPETKRLPAELIVRASSGPAGGDHGGSH
jgi:LacI family transcriptional regulator